MGNYTMPVSLEALYNAKRSTRLDKNPPSLFVLATSYPYAIFWVIAFLLTLYRKLFFVSILLPEKLFKVSLGVG